MGKAAGWQPSWAPVVGSHENIAPGFVRAVGLALAREGSTWDLWAIKPIAQVLWFRGASVSGRCFMMRLFQVFVSTTQAL